MRAAEQEEIYRTEDAEGIIVVTRAGGRQTLHFGSSLEQSSVFINRPWHLVHEYTRIMLLGLVFSDVQRVLISGLGGGGLVHCLNYYYAGMHIQVLENRQAVIDVAYQYFELPNGSNLQINCTDAFEYIEALPQQCTDIILSDLYGSEGMSELQQQHRYIEACSRALTDRGWLVVNFHRLPEENSTVMKVIKTLFSEIYICDVFKGNQVIFCGKTASSFTWVELAGRAKNLSSKVDMSLLYYFKQLKNI